MARKVKDWSSPPGFLLPLPPATEPVVLERQWIDDAYDELTHTVHVYPSDQRERHETAPSFAPTCWCSPKWERLRNGSMVVIHSHESMALD